MTQLEPALLLAIENEPVRSDVLVGSLSVWATRAVVTASHPHECPPVGLR